MTRLPDFHQSSIIIDHISKLFVVRTLGDFPVPRDSEWVKGYGFVLTDSLCGFDSHRLPPFLFPKYVVCFGCWVDGAVGFVGLFFEKGVEGLSTDEAVRGFVC